jgi:hypothetical protein
MTVRQALERMMEKVDQAEFLCVLYFLRICSLPILAWGLFNLWELTRPGLAHTALVEKRSDAALRVIGGAVLCLVWVLFERQHRREQRR